MGILGKRLRVGRMQSTAYCSCSICHGTREINRGQCESLLPSQVRTPHPAFQKDKFNQHIRQKQRRPSARITSPSQCCPLPRALRYNRSLASSRHPYSGTLKWLINNWHTYILTFPSCTEYCIPQFLSIPLSQDSFKEAWVILYSEEYFRHDGSFILCLLILIFITTID